MMRMVVFSPSTCSRKLIAGRGYKVSTAGLLHTKFGLACQKPVAAKEVSVWPLLQWSCPVPKPALHVPLHFFPCREKRSHRFRLSGTTPLMLQRLLELPDVVTVNVLNGDRQTFRFSPGNSSFSAIFRSCTGWTRWEHGPSCRSRGT